MKKIFLITGILTTILFSGCTLDKFNTEDYIWENWEDSKIEVQK